MHDLAKPCGTAHNAAFPDSKPPQLLRIYYRELRKTKLKECYIVRYADDFKIFCRKHSDAVRLFAAVKAWLKERLNLDISPEKSKIVNLKHDYSDFLGFRIKVHKGKNNQYVVISHIAPKALQKIKDTAKEKVKAIQHSSDDTAEYAAINNYNSYVMGIHNYYGMATAANPDMMTLCTSHYIRYDVLYPYVLSRLQYWTKLTLEDENALLRRLLKAEEKEQARAGKNVKATLKKAQRRLEEIDRLYMKL